MVHVKDDLSRIPKTNGQVKVIAMTITLKVRMYLTVKFNTVLFT